MSLSGMYRPHDLAPSGEDRLAPTIHEGRHLAAGSRGYSHPARWLSEAWDACWLSIGVQTRLLSGGSELVGRRRSGNRFGDSVLSDLCIARAATIRGIRGIRDTKWQQEAHCEQARTRGWRRGVETVFFAVTIVAVLWAVLSGKFSSEDEMFYLFFPPMILVAVRRGLRGATAAILAMDTGIILALQVYPRSQQRTHFASVSDVDSLDGRAGAGGVN